MPAKQGDDGAVVVVREPGGGGEGWGLGVDCMQEVVQLEWVLAT